MEHGFIAGILTVMAVVSIWGLVAMWQNMPVKKLCPLKRNVHYRNDGMR